MWVLAAIAAAVALDHLGAAIATTLTTVGILVGLNAIEHGFIAMRRGVHAEEENPSPESRYSGPWGP